MDRKNRFLQRDLPGLSGENADTASPRDRIGKPLRDRLFAEENGVYTRETVSVVARPVGKRLPTKEQLLARIQNDSIAMAQATLYLDTHPGDPTFLRYYETYRRRLTDAVRTYESHYGKLCRTLDDRRELRL